MNRNLLVILFTFSALCAKSQVDVTLHMDQQLGGKPFSYNTAAEADMGYVFTVTRLQYYISEIKLVHDGGVITPVTDMYLLVDPAENSQFDLGQFQITTLEKIQFSVGVDEAHNHLDPSTYPSDHPLAHQNPSMHWGWASGYRFIAMEGFAGTDTNSMNNNYQIHTIGDNNYTIVTIDVSGVTNGNSMDIFIQADYENFLNGLDASAGLISHASTGASSKIARNSLAVFSAAATTSTITPGVIGIFTISPNPVRGWATIRYDVEHQDNLVLTITDLMGRVVYDQQLHSAADAIGVEMNWPAGMYVARLMTRDQLLAVEKIMVQ